MGRATEARTSLIDTTGSRLSLTTGSTTRWTLFDHLGSLVGLISADGSLAETYRTDGAGGELRGTADQTDIDAGARNPFRFRGAINLGTDADPLYEMGARFYAPSAGVWTQMDTSAGSAATLGTPPTSITAAAIAPMGLVLPMLTPPGGPFSRRRW
ncbi:MAG: RHS repeat-associated core domain-containing protein [Candidatus Limnocylindrales bacterium]